METAVTRDGIPFQEPEARTAGDEPFDLPCIRCGVCCTVYQVRLSPSEAQTVADAMGFEYWDWVGRFCDPRWPDPRSHLIRHDDRGCVFLDRPNDQVALCRIYRVRPSACRDWAADVFKPACQDGLKRIWHISVDASGRLQATAEARNRFDEFLAGL